MFRWLRRMFNRTVDASGWDAVHERARVLLENARQYRDTSTMKDDPVIEAEYRRAERLVRETGEKAGRAV